MAYVVLGSQVNELQNTAATSYTPTIYPTDVQNGDLVVAFVEWNAAAAVLSCATSGWSIVGTRGSNPTQAAYGQFFYAVVSGGTYNVPTFSSTVSGRAGMVMFLVRDADTSAPIDVALQTNFAIPNPTSGAPTTSTNNCLILHGWAHSGVSVGMQPDRSKAQIVDTRTEANSPTALVTFSGQVAAGVVESYTAAAAATTGGGAQWTIAIKNKTGGRPTPDVRYDLEVVSWYGNTAAAVAPLTWYGPEQTGNKFAGGISGAALGGIAITSGAITTSSSLAATTINTSATNNVLDGAWHAVTLDCTDKIFAVEIGTSRPGNNASGTRIGPLGLLVGFSDGTNYQIFRVKNPAKGWLAAVDYRVFIACGVSTPMYSSGTLNWAAITQVAYFLHHLQTAVDTLSVKNAFLIGGCSLTGGSSGLPTTAAEFARIMLQSRLTGMVSLQSSAQTQIRHSLTIGDGARPTYFNSEAASVAFPQAWSALPVSNWQDEWQVSDGACAVGVKAAAGDEISFGASVVSSQTRQTFAFDPTSSGAATYDFGGCSFVGLDNVWNTDAPCSQATFLRCHTILGNSAAFDSCTFKSCASAITAYVSLTDGGSIVDSAFIKGSETYAIDLTEAGSYDLSNTTFSGYTNVLYVSATTGTVTVTLADGQTPLSYVSAGATVVFDVPALFQSVTINGLLTASRVYIYDTVTATILANAVVTGSTYTWTDSVAAVADRNIWLRVAYQSGTSAKKFIDVAIGTCGTTGATAAVTYLANQEDDDVYITNAIDGSTVTGISIDDSIDRVVMSIAGGAVTWPEIYAYQVYWLATSAGIVDDAAIIEAIDTANYLLYSFQIRNTSTVPLTITGGYGRDAVTETVAACIDVTGSTGNIYPAPDHVVPFSTGSGLTAGQAAKLESLDTQAVNLVSIKGQLIQGAGLASDPWGP